MGEHVHLRFESEEGTSWLRWKLFEMTTTTMMMMILDVVMMMMMMEEAVMMTTRTK